MGDDIYKLTEPKNLPVDSSFLDCSKEPALITQEYTQVMESVCSEAVMSVRERAEEFYSKMASKDVTISTLFLTHFLENSKHLQQIAESTETWADGRKGEADRR